MLDSEELTGRIIEWFKTGSTRPFMLELRPTNRCNLRCPSCIARGQTPSTPGEELSAEEYERIIDEAAALGVKYVQIGGGGEPFLRGKDLLRTMWRIKRHGMAGWVVSNGTLFSEDIIDEIGRMRWETVFLSLDAPEPELNDFLRGEPGTFDQIVASIRRFHIMRDRYGGEVPHVDIGTVLSHFNCRMIAEMVELCADLGIGQLLFQPVRVRDDMAGERFKLTDEDLKALIVEIPRARKLAGRLGVRNNLHELDCQMLRGSSKLPEVIQSYSSGFKGHPLLSIPCFSPWYYVGISADGAVGPCSIDHPTTYLSDIRSSSLRECWQDHFEGFRGCLMGGKLPQTCVNCCGTKVIETRKLRERLQQALTSGIDGINASGEV